MVSSPGSPETSLVSLEVAKAHLRVTHTEEDADIQRKMRQATDIVRQRLIASLDATDNAAEIEEIWSWDEDTVPDRIQAAILNQLKELWKEDRDETRESPTDGTRLSPRVERYLNRDKGWPLA